MRHDPPIKEEDPQSDSKMFRREQDSILTSCRDKRKADSSLDSTVMEHRKIVLFLSRPFSVGHCIDLFLPSLAKNSALD